MPIRVLLADDHEVVRLGLCQVLQQCPEIQVVAEAADGLEAVEAAQRCVPDVAVLDISMPRLNGIDAARQIRRAQPEVRLIALSMNGTRQFVMDMLAAGAQGYLLKTDASEDVVRAVQAVMRDEVYLSPKIAAVVTQACLQQAGGASDGQTSTVELTTRERQVLQLLAEGHSSKQIAALLGMEQNTVMVHRRHVMQKLGLHSVAELTKYAIQEGLTSLEH